MSWPLPKGRCGPVAAFQHSVVFMLRLSLPLIPCLRRLAVLKCSVCCSYCMPRLPQLQLCSLCCVVVSMRPTPPTYYTAALHHHGRRRISATQSNTHCLIWLLRCFIQHLLIGVHAFKHLVWVPGTFTSLCVTGHLEMCACPWHVLQQSCGGRHAECVSGMLLLFCTTPGLAPESLQALLQRRQYRHGGTPGSKMACTATASGGSLCTATVCCSSCTDVVWCGPLLLLLPAFSGFGISQALRATPAQGNDTGLLPHVRLEGSALLLAPVVQVPTFWARRSTHLSGLGWAASPELQRVC